MSKRDNKYTKNNKVKINKPDEIQYASKRRFKGSHEPSFFDEKYFMEGVTSNYGRKDEKGNLLFAPYDEQSYLPRNRMMAATFVKMFNPKTAIVLGCARGYLVKALRELGVDAVGVDISEWAIFNSPPELRDYLYVGDICDLSLFSSETFDLVVATDVFEHIKVPDLYTALNEARRVCRDTLVVDVPTGKNDKEHNQSHGTDKSHVSVYTEKWWLEQLLMRGYWLNGKHSYTYPDGSTGCTALLRLARPRPTIQYDENYRAFVNENEGVEEGEVCPLTPVVDIIMLNYNNFDHIVKCIDTLYRNTDYPFNLIVVDNQSTDGSFEWLQFASLGYPNMKLVANKQLDSGFAAGINTGLKYSGAPYVLLLNNDILVPKDSGWLRRMVAEAEDPDFNYGIVTPKLLYPDGSIQYGGQTFDAENQPYHVGRFKRGGFDRKREYPAGTFACALIKREVLAEIGGLDERYLIGTFEDTDYCCRARFNGWQILYDPEVVLYHFEGATQLNRPREVFQVQQALNYKRFMAQWSEWLTYSRGARPEVFEPEEA